MAKISKREKENKSKVEAQKFYALNEAVELVKALANAKFNESVDIAVQLGIDFTLPSQLTGAGGDNALQHHGAGFARLGGGELARA